MGFGPVASGYEGGVEDEEAERHRPGEVRLLPAVAVVVAIGLNALLPDRLSLTPRYLLPAIALILFVPLVAANPHRMTRQTRWLRHLSIGLVILMAATNTVSLVLVILDLVSGQAKQGTELLVAALQVWVTNIIVYGLAFWELDRGGPVLRTQRPHDRLPKADFRFPQDEDHDAIEEVRRRSSQESGWTPAFVDYFYVSVTNSSAFSPTDTMPLSPRIKLLMASESVSALVLSVLVISRGVGILK